MKKYIAFIACMSFIMGYSQIQNDTTGTKQLDEVVKTSQRFLKSKRKISQQIESISKKEIEFQNFQTTADALSNSGTLAVQRSQQGGGSPVIRGFEANRILLLVDGIRMNNLIYRAGHLQNIITVDKYMLENIDVLYGPSSTLYGSDAMGGAIYLQTKNAKLHSENDSKFFTGNAILNYSTVNEGKSGHFDFNFAGQKWASLTSFSYSDYGDLKMGEKRNGSQPFFGERPFYVENINGVDTQVVNDNKYLQKFSGYTQYDFMQKLIYEPSSGTRHSLNLQASTTSDVPRYDRLTDFKEGNFVTATWNYGPQKRLLAVYKFYKEKVFLNSDMNLTLSYQNVEESRITRNFGNPNQKTRIEKVTVYALNSDFKAKVGHGSLNYGADVFYDDLNSSAIKKNILTGFEEITDTRYPDGKNNTFRAEGFALFNNSVTEKTSYNASLRVGYTNLKSTIANNILNLPYTSVNQSNLTYSGAFGVVNNPTKNLKVSFNLSTAYRVPNIDDLSKIFESDSKKGTLIVPNKDLKPERSITGDINFSLYDGDLFKFENTLYYTILNDAIVTDSFQFNGQSVIDYEGKQSTVLANQNLGKATIIGYSTTLKATIVKNVNFYGSFTFTHGRIDTKTGEKPLDHIPPVYGKTGFDFKSKWVQLDLYLLYSGKKDIKDYFLNGEDNEQYAPATGMPSWETYNFKAAVQPIPGLTLYTGIENILDTQYRTFASGINAPGRNVYFGTKYTF
jgi:hemoglobin/transferrin/lactoferrin receptor protein